MIQNKCGIGEPLSQNLTDDELYNFFIKNIYHGNLKIHGSNIKVFTTPFEDNRMQGYFHLTTKTQRKFGIKLRMKEQRAYFINYIQPMINNYNTCSKCDDNDCEGIKVWSAPYKNKKRTKLLYSNGHYSYIIILEQNKKDYYLITSYLIDEPGYLQNILNEYNKYKKSPK